MAAYLLMVFLLILSAESAVRPFEQLPKQDVPAELFASDAGEEICESLSPAECQAKFLQEGDAWAGDIDDDGHPEILLYPHNWYAGSGGRSFFLYQRREGSWESLFADNWLIAEARLQILPRTRTGYHDLRLGGAFCVKWTGSHYVSYEDDNYRALDAGWFDADDFSNAELFWKIHYGGAKVMHFEPQWFAVVPSWSVTRKLADPEYGLEWWATFKGGVYGVHDGRAFLLLPRPSYLGAGKLELQGDWLLIYEPEEPPGPPTARYNRRTQELRMESHEQD